MVKKEFQSKMIPFYLQFFGDEGNGEGNGAENPSGNDENSGAGNQNGNDGQSQRTFTQDEVSRMMTREKQQGKQSVLNALGFKTEDEAKSAFNLLKALQDSQKSEADRKEEEKNTAIQSKADAEKRAEVAEAKLSCVVNGVSAESVDDVLVIALAKVTDGKTLDDVIKEMKGEARYASFFGSKPATPSGDNTGKSLQNNPSGTSGTDADYGKRIAEAFGAKTGTPNAKSKFF